MSAKSKSNPLPQYLEWRDGRPRWGASPKLKKLGWRGCDLRDAHGSFVDLGEAIRRATAINEAVAGFLAGVAVPPIFAACAPASGLQTADGRTPSLPTPPDKRSIGHLFDTYFEELEGERAPKTLTDYRLKIGVTLKTIAELRGKTLADVRAQDIAMLKQPAEGSGQPFHLLDAYKQMKRARGVPMAKGCITATAAWLSWVKFDKSLLSGENPCRAFKTETPEGRVVTLDDDEIAALVAAADYVGLPSLGDAIVLAIDLTWAQQDLLGLTWDKIGEDGDASGKRKKTNVTMFPILRGPGRERIAAIRERQAAWPEAVRPTAENAGHVICSELDRGPWKADYFRHWFAMLRDIASAEAPYGLGNNGIREKRFQDLRDTAITMLDEIGMSEKMMATRSGHQFGSVARTTAKHYSERKRVAKGANQWLAAHDNRQPD